jgi:two-component system sensor histidine kinase DesK
VPGGTIGAMKVQRPPTRPRVWPIVVVVFVVLLAVLLAAGADGPLAVALPSAVAVTAVAFAAWAARRAHLNRVDYEARLTRWAAAEAVLAERLRIARDLHDIVSHGLGLITVCAAGAQHVARSGDESDVAELRVALANIETASRQATAELRRMLSVLRTFDEPAAPRLPLEGLDELPAIVRSADVAGLRIRLTLEDVGVVSRGVQIAVCKTVREALNNAARHVGPTDVRVHVYRDQDAVVTTIADGGPHGPWRSVPGAGHGLAGLHERISALGGVLRAEPVGTGFYVVARIPDEVVA